MGQVLGYTAYLLRSYARDRTALFFGFLFPLLFMALFGVLNFGGSVRDTSKGQNDASARIQLPDERAGLAFVFRVFDRVSYALIMQATKPVAPLDVVQTP